MNSLIQCSHADFGYENQDAVVDVTMEVNPGDYICIVGENGSGKSTLMKGLLGLLKPTKGTISVSDELKKSGIGYLPQQTAAQKDFPKLAEKNMERLGIAELGSQCYRDLSGGQQQRTLIARALCATDRLLILDEPITGLDPSAILEFYEIIRKLNRKEGVAILMVSHDIANVVKQAGKILHLKREVLFYGTTKEYLESSAGHLYLGGEL